MATIRPNEARRQAGERLEALIERARAANLALYQDEPGPESAALLVVFEKAAAARLDKLAETIYLESLHGEG